MSLTALPICFLPFLFVFLRPPKAAGHFSHCLFDYAEECTVNEDARSIPLRVDIASPLEWPFWPVTHGITPLISFLEALLQTIAGRNRSRCRPSKQNQHVYINNHPRVGFLVSFLSLYFLWPGAFFPTWAHAWKRHYFIIQLDNTFIKPPIQGQTIRLEFRWRKFRFLQKIRLFFSNFISILKFSPFRGRK